MGWGWYIQNDMQLFVLSMLVLFIYSIKPLLSKILILILTIGSFIFTFSYTYRNSILVSTHLVDFLSYGDYFIDVYFKPWARCPPYLLGILLGMLYHEHLLVEKTNKAHQDQVFEGDTLLCKMKKKCHQNRMTRIAF